mmetsp:Transcript_21074/g.57610  ORF Transcript_21074/g.57610 Transcript_21074/m.57610 type:complete len:330 (+) Transcript_21074:1090-2079(+)
MPAHLHLLLRLLQERGRCAGGSLVRILRRCLHSFHGRGAPSHGLCQPDAHALLHEADCLRRGVALDIPLHNPDSGREGRELVLAGLGPLVPSLCLVGAHARELLEVLLIFEKDGRGEGKLLAGRGDLILRLCLLFLGVVQLEVLLLEQCLLLLHERFVRVHGLHFLLVNGGFLRLEVLKELLQCPNDFVGVVLVVLHLNGRCLLQETGEVLSRVAPEAEGIRQQPGPLHGPCHAADLRERRRLGGLERLDRALQRLKGCHEVRRVLLVLGQLLSARLHGGLLVLLSLLDVRHKPRNGFVEAVALRGKRCNVGGKRRLLVHVGGDGIALL